MDGGQTEVTLHPEALPLLKGLRERGIRTGVISNFEHYPHVRKVLAGTGLHQVDRKSTRLNSSHQIISYAVFCLKKKKTNKLRHNHVTIRPPSTPRTRSPSST